MMDNLKEKLKEKITFCSEYFNRIERYKLADSVICSIIEYLPNNDSMKNVLTKVVLINSLYGTAIYNTVKIAEHICKNGKNIDTKIKGGELSVINDIRISHGIKTQTNRERDFYSFATKYVSFHAPDKYPMYDSLLKRLLPELNKTYNFHKRFNQNALTKYQTIKSVIDSLIDYLALDNDFKYKKIDQALWLYAKYLYRGNELDKSIYNELNEQLRDK